MTVCLSVSHVSMQFDECENECAVSECASDSPSVAPAAALARGHSLDMSDGSHAVLHWLVRPNYA
jgi:hypothetical protein